jgi:glycosyltransferase involved in cell wall biosynthesis
MRIAFLGLYGSFGHRGIGGTESIVRRIAYELADRAYTVEFVRFGVTDATQECADHNVTTSDFARFEDALKYVASCDHVVTIYIPPKLRILFARFRRQHGDGVVFHRFFQNWPESRLKRELAQIDARSIPFNGMLFCVSPRLFTSVSNWSANARLLWPPVPDNFFLSLDQKASSRRLRVTYMGRLDKGKGTGSAINIFQELAPFRDSIQTTIFGYAWTHDLESVRLHKTLVSQNDIEYVPTKQQGYSAETDVMIRNILCQTDVLLLPYARLSSTIDTPLVLLEGMAHLTAVVTRPVGDLPAIYGSDHLMFDDFQQLQPIVNAIVQLRHNLAIEQQRIASQVERLGYRTSEIVDVFLSHLNGRIA